MSQPTILHHPKETYFMDFIDMHKYKWKNLGYSYVLTLIDGFSRYVFLYPTKTKEGAEQEICLRHLFGTLENVPKVLHGDGEFHSNYITGLGREFGFRSVWSSPYMPNGNAMIERLNKTLKEMIFQYFERHATEIWIDALQAIAYNINHTKHSITKKRPVDVFFGGEVDIKRVDTTLKKYRHVTAQRLPDIVPYKKNDMVRIAMKAFASYRKGVMLVGAKSYKPHWSKDVYEISQVLMPRQEGRIITYRLRGLSRIVKHDQLLLVKKVDRSELNRPVYHEEFYSREE